jgi:hypothetical protein
VWLAVRTGEEQYKEAALEYYQKHEQEEGGGNWKNYGWDGNGWGAAVMMSRYENSKKRGRGREEGASGGESGGSLGCSKQGYTGMELYREEEQVGLHCKPLVIESKVVETL